MKAQATPARNQQILEEASAWFVDFRIGDIDAVSRERFDEWLRQSPDHIRAYMEIAKTYVELPTLKSVSPIDVHALIASARRDATVVSFETPPLTPPLDEGRGRGGARALAASFLLVLAVASATATWLWQHRYPTYSTDIGENRSITLADGSMIDLNARSRVQIRFSKGERDVELLAGQALFEVAKDAARPFIVRSGGALVRAVGTQFDVNRGLSGTTVTVLEGRVAVLSESSRAPLASPRFREVGPNSNASRSGDTERSGEPADVTQTPNLSAAGATYVSAGEQVTVTAHQVSAPKRADVAATTGWTQHRMIFDDTPLTSVVDEFNRYNSRPLVIEDASLNDFHVGGVYASTDPASLIRFLRAQPGVEVTESEASIRIRRK